MTVDLPKELHREAERAAADRGVPVATLVVEGLQKLLDLPTAAGAEPAWKRHVGTLSAEAADEMERFLRDADFSKVHPGVPP